MTGPIFFKCFAFFTTIPKTAHKKTLGHKTTKNYWTIMSTFCIKHIRTIVRNIFFINKFDLCFFWFDQNFGPSTFQFCFAKQPNEGVLGENRKYKTFPVWLEGSFKASDPSQKAFHPIKPCGNIFKTFPRPPYKFMF